MSVLDELRDYEMRVIDRLKELEPLVDEYQQLERLAERLGLDRSAPAAGAGRRPPHSTARTAAKPASRRTAKRRAGTPGRKPQRRDQVLEIVKARPGITVPDIAKEIGVDPTGLYRVVRQLEKEALVTKSGMQISPRA